MPFYKGHKINIGRKCRKGTKIKIGKATRKYQLNQDFFSTYTPQSCYWAGFITADGNVYKNVLIIALNQKDRNHLQKFLETINSNYPIRIDNGKRYGKPLVRIDITSKKLIKDLKDNFNIVPRKSLNLEYPAQMPKNLDRYFIRGYFDGDGCLGQRVPPKHKKLEWRFAVCSGSLNFLNHIQDILIENCNLNKNKIYSRENNHSFEYAGNVQVPRIMSFLDVSFALSRKNLQMG